MKKLLLLSVIFLLIPLSFGVNSADFLVVDGEITSNFVFLEGTNAQLDYLDVSMEWVFEDDFRQNFLFVNYDSSYQDGVFRITNTSVNSASIFFRVESTNAPLRVNRKVEFPLTSIPSQYIQYTRPTELIDINSDIRILANQIAHDEDDLFIIVSNLASWVNQNIDYDLSTLGQEAQAPSTQVLIDRAGVCTEMSILFISMARSLGIPARFVTGLAYTDSDLFDEPWGLHGWAEVYFPDIGWVQFDPTYNQIGYIDASHIALDRSVDAQQSQTRFVWRGRNVEVNPLGLDLNAQIISQGLPKRPELNIEVSPLAQNINFDSYNVIEVEITNLRSYYVAREISLASVSGVFDQKSQNVVLGPWESKNLYFILEPNPGLDSSFLYTLPLNVYTPYEQETSSFTIRRGGERITSQAALAFEDVSSENDLICDTQRFTYWVNESIEINCFTSYEGEFCHNGDCKEVNGNFSFQHQFETPGLVTDTIRLGEHRAVVSFNIIDVPKVGIQIEGYNKNIGFETQTYYVTISKESYSDLFNVAVYLENSFLRSKVDFSKLSDEQRVRFVVEPDRLSRFSDLELKVVYHDSFLNSYEETMTLPIRFENTSFSEKIKILVNNFKAILS